MERSDLTDDDLGRIETRASFPSQGEDVADRVDVLRLVDEVRRLRSNCEECGERPATICEECVLRDR